MLTMKKYVVMLTTSLLVASFTVPHQAHAQTPEDPECVEEQGRPYKLVDIDPTSNDAILYSAAASNARLCESMALQLDTTSQTFSVMCKGYKIKRAIFKVKKGNKWVSPAKDKSITIRSKKCAARDFDCRKVQVKLASADGTRKRTIRIFLFVVPRDQDVGEDSVTSESNSTDTQCKPRKLTLSLDY